MFNVQCSLKNESQSLPFIPSRAGITLQNLIIAGGENII
jgi:hypothetical protein